MNDTKKYTRLVLCSTRTPSEITKQKPWVWRMKGFCLCDFWEGSGWTEYQTCVVFNIYPVISCIYIFLGKYSCFHIAIYLMFFTSDSLCLNVHLNYLSLDNHLVSKQPQWQCHVTMTSQWGHVTKQILNVAGWAKLEEIKTNDLTIIWAWYDHNF